MPYDWAFWAREKQIPPHESEWRIWNLVGGRGAGKTRSGAETVRAAVDKGYRHIGLVGRSAGDVRDVMVEGPSGILSVFPPWQRPKYEPSKRRITFHNGAVATTFSAEKADQLRGPNFDFVWCDELAAWRDVDAWDQVQFALRLGDYPRCIVTTTPRPTKIIRDLIADPDCITTTESTLANAGNLAPAYLAYILKRYQDTTLGQQEIYARILDDVPGALWTRAMIELNRVKRPVELERIVVAIDPAVTGGEDSEETGIIVAGRGVDKHAYVLDDFSLRDLPAKWAKRAIFAYHEYEADRIIGEANNGGDMIELTLRTQDKSVSYRKVTASRGKKRRAEPVSALYEQGMVHHCGVHPEVEDEMCTWIDGESGFSPNRMDALVWALTELMITPSKGRSDVL